MPGLTGTYVLAVLAALKIALVAEDRACWGSVLLWIWMLATGGIPDERMEGPTCVYTGPDICYSHLFCRWSVPL